MNYKIFIKFLSYLWLGGIASAFFAFITQVVLARYMNIPEFGMFNSGVILMVIISTIYGFGTDAALLKVFGKSYKYGLSYTRPLIVYLIFSAIALTCISFVYIYILFPNDYSLNAYKLIPTFIAISLLNVKFSILQIEKRFEYLSFCQILLNGSRLLFVIIYFLLGKDLTSGVYNIFFYSSILLIIFCIPNLMRLINKSKKIPQKNLISFILMILPFGIITSTFAIYSQSIIIITNSLLSKEVAGYLSVALNIMLAIYILPVVVYQKILLPMFHRQAFHDENKLLHNYQEGCKYMLLIGVIIFTLVFLFSEKLIILIFGIEYKEAAYIVKYISFCIPLRFLSSNAGAVLSTKNLVYKKMFSTVLLSVIAVITSYYLLKIFNLKGIILSILLNEVLMFILYFYMLWKYSFGNNTFKNWLSIK
ncbi:TPA: oligosaccharide flippase family protein [Citrobacter braakii]|uniref:oligosaccharide flippase family protein n=1 Tax=Enterobacteriaceae TaxID=543 RepID=UPI001F1453E1|nr:oligosaccharide flippase family protein [Escherichia coli]MCH6435049.1 oligosaccharide flippase family protein [Escherichia coli]HCB1918769.1 oligosaccharide flippase family protein [Citrobacter braakii]